MSQTNGLSENTTDQPLSDEQAKALFDEIYNANIKNEPVTGRQLAKVEEEVKAHEDSKASVEEPSAIAETTTEAQATATAQAPTQETAQQPSTPVVVKPEDYEAVLAEKAKWEQKAKSLDGREAARMREIKQLQDDLAKLKNQQQQPQPNQKQAPKNDPRWDALKAADPDLAGILEDLKEQLKAEAKEEAVREAKELVNRSVEPIYQKQHDDYANRELDRLVELIPNALEIKNHPAYAEWYFQQPKYIQDAATESAEGAAFVMHKYGFDMSLRYPQQQTQQEPVTDTKQTPDPKVAQLQAEREKRLQVAPVNQKQTVTAKSDTLDPEALFNKVFNESVKKR